MTGQDKVKRSPKGNTSCKRSDRRRLTTVYNSSADPVQTGMRMAEPDGARTVSCMVSVFDKGSPPGSSYYIIRRNQNLKGAE